MRRLSTDEKIWLGYVRLGKNLWNDKKYPFMTAKQFKKFCEREKLWK